jgi:carbon storage regulator
MLVIRRRPGETLVISEDIEVEILEASSSQVKLGIRAPKSVQIVRKEIQITRRQNLAAAEEISPATLERIANFSRSLPLRR